MKEDKIIKLTIFRRSLKVFFNYDSRMSSYLWQLYIYNVPAVTVLKIAIHQKDRDKQNTLI